LFLYLPPPDTGGKERELKRELQREEERKNFCIFMAVKDVSFGYKCKNDTII